jgi:hypothetical protein
VSSMDDFVRQWFGASHVAVAGVWVALYVCSRWWFTGPRPIRELELKGGCSAPMGKGGPKEEARLGLVICLEAELSRGHLASVAASA